MIQLNPVHKKGHKVSFFFLFRKKIKVLPVTFLSTCISILANLTSKNLLAKKKKEKEKKKGSLVIVKPNFFMDKKSLQDLT